MRCYQVIGETLPEAYHRALMILHDVGEVSDCADWNTTQKECSMSMVVVNPLKEPMISKCFIGGHRGLQQYMMEMLDGILDFEIAKGNWEYTYHDRMVRYPYSKDGYCCDQISFVVNELKRNPSSRRAVIMIRSTEDIGSDEPACMQHVQYFIRNNKLDCMVLFRSNDACKATFMNAFAMIMLQKRIADMLGVEAGTYTHTANSFHCYERDFELLDGYIKRIQNEDMTFDYVGDWQDEMEEYVDEILKTVKRLKG